MNEELGHVSTSKLVKKMQSLVQANEVTLSKNLELNLVNFLFRFSEVELGMYCLNIFDEASL